MYDHVTLANDTTKYACIPYFPGQNPILPVYAGKMGILRVKQDSPYLSKNNDVNQTTIPCPVVFWCIWPIHNKLLP